jgi:CBS domain-containing protein
MSTDPKFVFPHTRFTEAEDLMRACKVNALVVKDLTGQMAGVLQIFDINNE